MNDLITRFSTGQADRVRPDPASLGGKGANLVTLCLMGLPVPPGFIIGTRFSAKYRKKGRLSARLVEAIRDGIRWLEEATGREFGSRRRPLLVAVRSGAPTSMPGMMDTILNIGLNDDTVEGLEHLSGNPRFAWDSYRRFITMYGDSVLGVPRSLAEETIAQFRDAEGVEYDWELDSAALARLTKSLRNRIAATSEQVFPQDPEEQLFAAIEAVFSSSDSERSQTYRELQGIEHEGTAVTVQAMVFGNSGANSGSGVAFSRNPSTGDNRLYVEFLYNAQGEDVVSGARSPDSGVSLERGDPDLYRQLRSNITMLETHFRDMQDTEFTIEDGRLFLLQTRSAKRSPLATLRVAVDMAEEGLITAEEAFERLRGMDPEQLSMRRLEIDSDLKPVASGTVASAGVAVGHVALEPERAVAMRDGGKDVILVRAETKAEDVAGMDASVGLLTARGGTTSHAAVVARQLGLCCIVGCEDLHFHDDGKVILGDTQITEGQVISLDGHTGCVYAVEVPVTSSWEPPELARLRHIAREADLALPF